MHDSSIGIGYCKYRNKIWNFYEDSIYSFIIFIVGNVKYILFLNDSCVLKDIIFLWRLRYLNQQNIIAKSVQFIVSLEYAQINNICIA